MQKACHDDNSDRGKSQMKIKIKEPCEDCLGYLKADFANFSCADNEAFIVGVFSLVLAMKIIWDISNYSEE